MTAFAVAPPASAQTTRITVGGAGPLYLPDPLTTLPLGRLFLIGTDDAAGPPLSLLEGYDVLNHALGENWFPDTASHVLPYPASSGVVSGSRDAPPVNQAVAMGEASLDEQIRRSSASGGKVVVAGLSEGTIVINREIADLAAHPESAPPPDRLSFALFASPETGLFTTYLAPGWTVPVANYTVRNGVPDSQYDVDVIFHQYDGFADPPDRPWNLLSVANAVMGTAYFHHATGLASRADTVEISSTTNGLGGTTTTHMIPSPTLPLLMPLSQIGLPSRIVDTLNAALKPVVDAGYSRLTPDAGPYFSEGRLRAKPAGVQGLSAGGGVHLPRGATVVRDAKDAPHPPRRSATRAARTG